MILTRFMVALAALVMSVTLLTPAQALPRAVAQAKANCIVGEKADGYLGFVPGKTAGTDLRRQVRGINQQRKSAYASLARKNGVSVEVTASLTAEKLIRAARPGECVRGTDGRWVKK
ncbi:MAG: YdbL family protein [Pseudomonadota bacterium]